jgi:hypothetical protein
MHSLYQSDIFFKLLTYCESFKNKKRSDNYSLLESLINYD